jgi:hypothetical protein
MARVTLDLPEELQAKVQSRAGEAGYKTVEEYIQALLRYDADPTDTDEEDHPFPPHLHFNTAEELEALLIEGANSPATEMGRVGLGDHAQGSRRANRRKTFAQTRDLRTIVLPR